MTTTDRAWWRAVEVALAGAAKDRELGPPLSEQQYLRALVDFANTGEWPNMLARRPTPRGKEAATIAGVRRRFRADLQALVDGDLTAADRKRIYTAADYMIMVPRTGDDGAVRYLYIPATSEAVAAHALRFLLASPEDQEDLKQCQWRLCNRNEDAPELPYVPKFFLVSQRREAQGKADKTVTGRRPDRYCCEEHMQLAHRERATRWTIEHRKKLREQAAAHVAAKHK